MINPILLFNIGLLGIAAWQIMWNWDAVKAHVTRFWQWCSRSDYMDVIAVMIVLGVVLINWMGYWL